MQLKFYFLLWIFNIYLKPNLNISMDWNNFIMRIWPPKNQHFYGWKPCFDKSKWYKSGVHRQCHSTTSLLYIVWESVQNVMISQIKTEQWDCMRTFSKFNLLVIQSWLYIFDEYHFWMSYFDKFDLDVCRVNLAIKIFDFKVKIGAVFEIKQMSQRKVLWKSILPLFQHLPEGKRCKEAENANKDG